MKTPIIILIVLFLLWKIQNYVSLEALHQQKTAKSSQNVLAKDMKDQLIGVNITQKVKQKIQQMNMDDSWNELLRAHKLFGLTYPNQNGIAKRYSANRCYIPKGVIKNYNVIINGKGFYDQFIDSDIKRYEKMKKQLIAGQGEDYTTAC